MSTDKPLHRPVTRYTIARIIYDEGAYCGECEYEGWKFCSECRRTVLRYADALLAAGVLGINADTIRADAWDEGIAAVVQYDEGLMIAEINRDAMIPDYPTNPYRKAAGA